jgi:class 3 adenylate cyclase
LILPDFRAGQAMCRKLRRAVPLDPLENTIGAELPVARWATFGGWACGQDGLQHQAGNVGAPSRHNVTAVGDTVDVAACLQAVPKDNDDAIVAPPVILPRRTQPG